jgi:protein TonB
VKRIWIAIALALGFHGMLLNMDFIKPMKKPQPDALLKPVAITLLNETPKPLKTAPAAHPPDPEPARQEPDKVSEPLPAPKPVPQPAPQQKPKAAPKVRNSPDPPLKTPESKPAPEMPQEYLAPADSGPKTPDLPASAPSRLDAETQPVKSHAASVDAITGQSASQSFVREATPLYDRNPPPRYPQQARKRGIQGRVILKVLVGRDGRVADIGLQESSGHSILDNVALETVKGWAFTPGRRGEDAVEMWIRVPVLFELK